MHINGKLETIDELCQIVQGKGEVNSLEGG